MSDRTTFVRFLGNVFGSVSRPHAENPQVMCPWCQDREERAGNRNYTKQKLSVKVSNHLVNCWVCGYRSRNLVHLLRTWYKSYLYLYLEEHWAPETHGKGWHGSEENSEDGGDTPHEVTLPDGWVLLAETGRGEEEDPPQVQAARRYLRSRGVLSSSDLWFWKFGVSEPDLPWRVILPSFDKSGNLSFWTARSVLQNPRNTYWNSQVPKTGVVFNEVNIDWSRELLITEGPFDLVACGPGFNATCVLGSRVGEKHLLFSRVLEHKTPVVLALDSDMVDTTLRLGETFRRLGIPCRVVMFPPGFKDLGEVAQATGTGGVKNLVREAQEFSPLRTRARMKLCQV